MRGETARKDPLSFFQNPKKLQKNNKITIYKFYIFGIINQNRISRSNSVKVFL